MGNRKPGANTAPPMAISGLGSASPRPSQSECGVEAASLSTPSCRIRMPLRRGGAFNTPREVVGGGRLASSSPAVVATLGTLGRFGGSREHSKDQQLYRCGFGTSP